MPRKKNESSKRNVGGVKATPKQEKFAKEYAVSGDRRKSLKAAQVKTKYPNQMASQMLKVPAVVEICNQTRAQIREVAPLGMAEVKQLAAELSMVSPIDVMEDDGTINVREIKRRRLGRFVKKVKVETTVDREGNSVTRTEIEGYSRLDALKLIATIQKDEDSRDDQIRQALESLFSMNPELRLAENCERVFNAFSMNYAVPVDKIRELFQRLESLRIESVKGYIDGEVIENT